MNNKKLKRTPQFSLGSKLLKKAAKSIVDSKLTEPIRKRIYKTIDPVGYSYNSDSGYDHIDSFLRNKPYEIVSKKEYNATDFKEPLDLSKYTDSVDIAKTNIKAKDASDNRFVRQAIFKKYLNLDKKEIPLKASYDIELSDPYNEAFTIAKVNQAPVNIKFEDFYKPNSDGSFSFKKGSDKYFESPFVRKSIEQLKNKDIKNGDFFTDKEGKLRKVLDDDQFGVMGGYNVKVDKDQVGDYLQFEDVWDIHPLQGYFANKYFFRDISKKLYKKLTEDVDELRPTKAHKYLYNKAEKLGDKLLTQQDKLKNIELGQLIGAQPVTLKQAWYLNPDGTPMRDSFGKIIEKPLSVIGAGATIGLGISQMKNGSKLKFKKK